jgi:hypothetical protein
MLWLHEVPVQDIYLKSGRTKKPLEAVALQQLHTSASIHTAVSNISGIHHMPPLATQSSKIFACPLHHWSDSPSTAERGTYNM